MPFNIESYLNFPAIAPEYKEGLVGEKPQVLGLFSWKTLQNECEKINGANASSAGGSVVDPLTGEPVILGSTGAAANSEPETAQSSGEPAETGLESPATGFAPNGEVAPSATSIKENLERTSRQPTNAPKLVVVEKADVLGRFDWKGLEMACVEYDAAGFLKLPVMDPLTGDPVELHGVVNNSEAETGGNQETPARMGDAEGDGPLDRFSGAASSSNTSIGEGTIG